MPLQESSDSSFAGKIYRSLALQVFHMSEVQEAWWGWLGAKGSNACKGWAHAMLSKVEASCTAGFQSPQCTKSVFNWQDLCYNFAYRCSFVNRLLEHILPRWIMMCTKHTRSWDNSANIAASKYSAMPHPAMRGVEGDTDQEGWTCTKWDEKPVVVVFIIL